MVKISTLLRLGDLVVMVTHLVGACEGLSKQR